MLDANVNVNVDEVYGNEWFGAEHLAEVVERLQQKKFPPLDESETSSIINRCWHGSFNTIQQLFGSSHGARRGEDADCKSHVCSNYSQTAVSVHATSRQRHSQQDTSANPLVFIKMIPPANSMGIVSQRMPRGGDLR